MFLWPIFFLPIVTDPFGIGKNWMILATGIIGVLIWLVDLLINKREGFRGNKVLGLMVLILIWAWIGWGREEVGVRMRSVMEIGGIGTITGLFLWFFLWLQVTDKEEERQQINWMTAAGMVAAAASIVVFLIPTAKLPIVWPKDNPILSLAQGWSLTGSLLEEMVWWGFLLMIWGKRLVEKLRSQTDDGYMVEAVVTAIFTLVLFLDIFKFVKLGWANLDGITGWVIAVETFKRSPFFGIGPGNFWQAFTSFRPTTFNATQWWTGSFKYSSSGILQLWTELGAVGLGLAGLVGWQMLREKKNYRWIEVLIMGVAAACLPMNLMTLMLLVWGLAVLIFEEKKVKLSLKMGESGFNIAPWLSGLALIAGGLFGSYWMGRILLGEVYMRNSLVAAAKNDGGQTYNLQIKAKEMNPFSAEYRKIYSQTNLALALTLLNNKEATDEDKQKASVLVQQAVQEGKSAIALNQVNASYWSNLAMIYRQLVGLVDGTADWSFQAYQQAAALDPVNPTIKLDLGGLLYAANRIDEADRMFEEAVAAKQDYANSWYNWAYTAKKNNKLTEAVSRLTQAVALVPTDSGDYDKANKELDQWKKELEEATKKQKETQQQETQKQAETLKAPEPLPTTNPKEKMVVPTGEMQPPVTEPVKPEVTPQLTPVPTR